MMNLGQLFEIDPRAIKQMKLFQNLQTNKSLQQSIKSLSPIISDAFKRRSSIAK